MGKFNVRGQVLRVLLACFLMALVLPATVSAAPPPSGTPAAQTGQASLTGVFTIIWGDPRPGSGGTGQVRYVLTDDNGVRTQLSIDDQVARAAGGVLALNRHRVTVTGAPTARAQNGSVTQLTVASISLAAPSGATPNVSAPVTGSQPYINVLCAFSDEAATHPKDVAYFNSLFSASYPGLGAYWSENSFGNINLSGTGTVDWHVLPQPRSYYIPNGGAANLDQLALDCTATTGNSVNYNNYTGINLMFNDVLDNAAWGGSQTLTLSGVTRVWGVTWMPPWGYYPDPNVADGGETVLAHETGHAFGLSHSGGPDGTTYQNGWDSMSDAYWNCAAETDPTYGCLGRHSIAYDKDLLGWVPTANKFTYTGGSRTITLSQLAVTAPGGDYLLAVIPHPGSSTAFTTVELRGQYGYDKKNPTSAVIIHEVDTTREDSAWVMGTNGHEGAEFLAGRTYTVPTTNVTVSVVSVSSTTATVRIGVPVNGDTIGVFRPSNGFIYLANQNSTSAPPGFFYGLANDQPVAGNWTGSEGKKTLGIYRPSEGRWYLRTTACPTDGSQCNADLAIYFGGAPGDLAVVGDWLGDGITRLGIYRHGQFILRLTPATDTTSTPTTVTYYLGVDGDVPLGGDWTAKGFASGGVFRPSNGLIYLRNSNTTGVADTTIFYGLGGDKPVVGDWNRDGITTFGVARGNASNNSNLILLRNENTTGPNDIPGFYLGVNGDVPIAGDWDGLPTPGASPTGTQGAPVSSLKKP